MPNSLEHPRSPLSRAFEPSIHRSPGHRSGAQSRPQTKPRGQWVPDQVRDFGSAAWPTSRGLAPPPGSQLHCTPHTPSLPGSTRQSSHTDHIRLSLDTRVKPAQGGRRSVEASSPERRRLPLPHAHEPTATEAPDTDPGPSDGLRQKRTANGSRIKSGTSGIRLGRSVSSAVSRKPGRVVRDRPGPGLPRRCRPGAERRAAG